MEGYGVIDSALGCEFWVQRLDDGPNKYTSDVLFMNWTACKDNGIEMPYPQRVVHHRGAAPG